MFKKVFFILILVAAAGFMIYKIAFNVISDENENANIRAIELYASTIRLSTVSIDNMMNENIIDYNSTDISSNVKCEKINTNATGEVTLKGCTVGNSKVKYKYTNGKAMRE